MIRKTSMKGLLGKMAILVLILTNTSCIWPHNECPDDTYLNLYLTSKGDYSQRLTQSPGKIGSESFVAWAVSGNRKLPLTDLTRLPLDVSNREIKILVETKMRTDTFVVTYDLQRKPCDSGGKDAFFLSVINLQSTKNTFNEPSSDFDISSSTNILY